MIALDERLFLAINSLIGNWSAFDSVIAFLVNDYFIMLLLAFMLLGLWFWGADAGTRFHLQTLVLWTAVGIVLTSLVISILNVYLPDRPRPFVTYPDVKLLFYRPHDPSFPANSAAVCFAAATGIWIGHRRAGAVAFVLAVVFGFSRVYAGVHYPGDVIGGALLGSVSVLVTCWTFKKLHWIPGSMVNLMRFIRLA